MPTVALEIRKVKDAPAIQRALDDPETYALVVIIGSLLPLTSRQQAAILNFATTMVDER
jgi:hypothetical protein